MAGPQKGNRSQLPSMYEVAEAIRDGESAANVAAEFGVAESRVRARLSQSGYDPHTGQPRREEVVPYKVTGLDEPLDWQNLAACRDADPEQFFIEGGQPAKARETCASCPVRARCLDWQLAYEAGMGVSYRYGVYGGMTGAERYRLAREGAA